MCAVQRQHEMQPMNYNVRNCMGIVGRGSYDRVAEVIRSERLDAAVVQELDSMTARYPGQDVLGKLSARTGMYATYAAAIDFVGGRYGIDMRTREDWEQFRRERETSPLDAAIESLQPKEKEQQPKPGTRRADTHDISALIIADNKQRTIDKMRTRQICYRRSLSARLRSTKS